MEADRFNTYESEGYTAEECKIASQVFRDVVRLLEDYEDDPQQMAEDAIKEVLEPKMSYDALIRATVQELDYEEMYDDEQRYLDTHL